MDQHEEKETGRIEAFSDGVFAIAIALLVLEIKVPNQNAIETIALAFQGLWRHVFRGGRLLAQRAKQEEIDGITKQFRFGPPLYLTAFILSFISVWLSVGLCIFLALFFAFPGLSSKQ